MCPSYRASHQEAEGSHGAEGSLAFCRVGSEPKRGPCPTGGCQRPQHHSRDSVPSSDSDKVVSQMFTHRSSCSCKGFVPGHYQQHRPPEEPQDLPGSTASLPSGTGAPARPLRHTMPGPAAEAGLSQQHRVLPRGFLLLLPCREGTHLPRVGMNPRNRDGPISLARSENSHSW